MKDIRIISRIIADLQKEKVRCICEITINDLDEQIEALTEFKKEIEDFRTIKSILTT